MNRPNERFDRLLSTAAEAQRAGQFEAALQNAEKALELVPDSVPAKFIIGVACARAGDWQRAADMLNSVLAADPSSYEALVSLCTLYRDIGRIDESVELGQRCIALRPNDAPAYNHLGRSLLSARRLDESIAAFERATILRPDFAPAYFNLGKAKQLLGKDGESAEAFEKAVRIAPTAENLLAYGQMLLTLCDFDGALGCGSHCISAFPGSAAAQLLVCGALTELGRNSEAEAHLRCAIELDPEGREAVQIATRQRPLGFIDEANDNLRRAIEQNPQPVFIFGALMQNTKATEQDRKLVDNMRGLLEKGSLSPTELASLHYGLGKALSDLEEYQDSMHHYDEANRITRLLKFGTARFDRAAYAARVDRVIEQFGSKAEGSGGLPSADPGRPNQSSSSHERPAHNASAPPILIVGMMRSGTSLMEQILSSHSDVAGAGEQLFWSRNWQRAVRNEGQDLDPEVAKTLGEEYTDHLEKFAGLATRVTDKMPGNYMFLGLIRLALPDARIVHVRRSPVDTCLSIWTTPNHMPHEGGHDKGDIAFVYAQYLRLMEHWRSILPSDRFLEVEYEMLVSEPEPEVRRILSFCGLPWDEACLRPQENRRLVNTPSAWQVRQPLYRTSVERWRKFEPWLGEFSELLEP